MEKKEKKSEGMTIGKLIKNLRDKNWIPRGDKEIVHCIYDVRNKKIGCYKDVGEELELIYTKTLRELASIESGLWQFVCENGMIKTGRVFISWTKNANCDNYGDLFWDKACPKDFYEYRLIESALCDEDKLEEFLLSNIKVDVGNRG